MTRPWEPKRYLVQMEQADPLEGEVLLKCQGGWVQRRWTGEAVIDVVEPPGNRVCVAVGRRFILEVFTDEVSVEMLYGAEPLGSFSVDTGARPFPDVWTSLCFCLAWFLSKGEIVGESANAACTRLLQYGLAHDERFAALFREAFPGYWWFREETYEPYNRLAEAMGSALDAQAVLNALADPE